MAEPHTLLRLGGFVEDDGKKILYSGGGIYSRPTVPKSSFTYRPTSIKSAQVIESACTTPLSDDKHLFHKLTPKTVTLTAWLKHVQRHFIKHGLDSVAYIVVMKDPTYALDIKTAASDPDSYEYNLFDSWGKVKAPNIKEFDTAVKASTCPLEEPNNRMACEFLRGSISADFLKLLDQSLPLDVSAGYMLWYIIHKVQSTNSAAGRELTSKVEGLRLSKEPGFHVDNLCLKLHPICTTLEGLGEKFVPHDFSVLVCACFDTINIMDFDTTMSGIANELDQDMEKYKWDRILEIAQEKFSTMRNTKRWLPASHGPSPAAPSGFPAQQQDTALTVHLKDISSKVDKLFQSQGGGSNSGGRTNVDHSQDNGCRYCKAKDHTLDKCPKLAAKNKKQGGGSQSSSTTGGGKSWKKTAPKNGESEVKKVTKGDGTTDTFKWCGKCKRWRNGAGAHVTSEHKSKASMSQTTSQVTPFISDNTYPFGLWIGATDSTLPFKTEEEESISLDPGYVVDDTEWFSCSSSSGPCDRGSFESSSWSVHAVESDSSPIQLVPKNLFFEPTDLPERGFFDETSSEESESPPSLRANIAVASGPGGPPEEDVSSESAPSDTSFLPWATPKTIADYAIYNTLYPMEPLLFDGQEVPPIIEAMFDGLDQDPLPDMTLIRDLADRAYPREFQGNRPLSYYIEWHDHMNDMEEDSADSEEEVPMDVEVHPKV